MLFGSTDIHLVSRISIVGVKACLIRFMECLAKASFSIGIFAIFQTLMFGSINVNFDNHKLVREIVLGKQSKIIYKFLYFEQAFP
ncbi:hypothetical protein Bca4012_095788 [Brassica carinata]